MDIKSRLHTVKEALVSWRHSVVEQTTRMKSPSFQFPIPPSLSGNNPEGAVVLMGTFSSNHWEVFIHSKDAWVAIGKGRRIRSPSGNSSFTNDEIQRIIDEVRVVVLFQPPSIWNRASRELKRFNKSKAAFEASPHRTPTRRRRLSDNVLGNDPE